VVGIGGVEMEKAGVELLVNQRELAVGGLVEVLGSVRRVLAAWRRMRHAIDADRPDLVVLVDSGPEPALRAQRAAGGHPTLYCQSAGLPGGAADRKIARRVDRLAVIFPFEREIYVHTGLPVDFVGHPLVERMCEFAALHDRATARAELDLDPERRWCCCCPAAGATSCATAST
jgi:lipid-A-disaccharide synthase